MNKNKRTIIDVGLDSDQVCRFREAVCTFFNWVLCFTLPYSDDDSFGKDNKHDDKFKVMKSHVVFNLHQVN